MSPDHQYRGYKEIVRVCDPGQYYPFADFCGAKAMSGSRFCRVHFEHYLMTKSGWRLDAELV